MSEVVYCGGCEHYLYETQRRSTNGEIGVCEILGCWVMANDVMNGCKNSKRKKNEQNS